MIVVDTGPLVAAVLYEDDDHRACVDLFSSAHLAGEQKYADLPLGVADASVVAVAEEFGVREVATLDRRHFSVVRPRHTNAFTLLP